MPQRKKEKRKRERDRDSEGEIFTAGRQPPRKQTIERFFCLEEENSATKRKILVKERKSSLATDLDMFAWASAGAPWL